ncbi:MAG: ribosome small subunit-dependent GTPase A [Simkaniaceae bacterium]|nr:ribosome small subunit-dependent GTPase A [Candidatus Sacchlamyda saccharinae]
MKDKHLEHEEAFHGKDKKEWRKERKILSKKDRSKYKKTDQDKQKKEVPDDPDLKQGRVLAILADGILVDFEDTLYTCSLRGALKKENLRIKNLIAVGDFVLFKPEEKSILYVEERTSILSRAEQVTRQKEQLIAVNVDQVLITASVGIPPLKPPLIDRYIIASLKGNMDPIIVVNKIDLLAGEETELFNEVLKIYQSLDIPIFPVSTVTGEGLDALKEAMKGKSSVFSGQSGAGKTSLINALIGSSYLTGEVIAKTKKGAHTTTTTRLLPLENDGFCVDTPGIKSFGLWDIPKEEIQQYFFEINEIAQNCKYPNCSHKHEPDCAVAIALEKGEISRLRFDSYCALIAPKSKR